MRPWVQFGAPATQLRPVVISVQVVALSFPTGAGQGRRIGSKSWLFRLAFITLVPSTPRAKPLQKRGTWSFSWMVVVVPELSSRR